MIPRESLPFLLRLAEWYPAVAITGPRQSGKSTLARTTFQDKPYISLEDPDQREHALNDPKGFLRQFPDGAILDEVQRVPELFSWLQTRIDADPRPGLFILTGSFQFGLMANITQSLAGRVGLLRLLPFSRLEVSSCAAPPKKLEESLLRGAYPPLFDRSIPSQVWYADYVATYVERDVRQLMEIRDLNTFQRFLRMCAARTGQLVNLSALAADCGITHNTAKSWLSVLQASFLVALLFPWHVNLGKRLVKTPKLYFLDTGLAAWLCGLRHEDVLSFGPMRGALFETWVVSECLKFRGNRILTNELFFWRDRHGKEMDILIDRGHDRTFAIECKAGETIAADWFQALRGFCSSSHCAGAAIVYGGDKDQPRSDMTAYSWENLAKLFSMAFGSNIASPNAQS